MSNSTASGGVGGNVEFEKKTMIKDVTEITNTKVHVSPRPVFTYIKAKFAKRSKALRTLSPALTEQKLHAGEGPSADEHL